MNRFPLELVHHILEYDGRIKYRHGKYMNQIAQDDDRYKMLQTMPKIEPIIDGNYWFTKIGMRKVNNRIKMYAVKTVSEYSGENPKINIYNTNREWDCVYDKQGIRYRFVLYKPVPTFTESVLQYIYTLCAVNSYKYFVI